MEAKNKNISVQGDKITDKTVIAERCITAGNGPEGFHGTNVTVGRGFADMVNEENVSVKIKTEENENAGNGDTAITEKSVNNDVTESARNLFDPKIAIKEEPSWETITCDRDFSHDTTVLDGNMYGDVTASTEFIGNITTCTAIAGNASSEMSKSIHKLFDHNTTVKIETGFETEARKRTLRFQDFDMEEDIVSIHMIPRQGNVVVQDTTFGNEIVSVNNTISEEKTGIADLATSSIRKDVDILVNKKDGNASKKSFETTLAPSSSGIKSKQIQKVSANIADFVKKGVLQKLKMKVLSQSLKQTPKESENVTDSVHKGVLRKRKVTSQSLNQTPVESEYVTDSVKKGVLPKRKVTSQSMNQTSKESENITDTVKKKVLPKRKVTSRSTNQTPKESENITDSVKKRVLPERKVTSQSMNQIPIESESITDSVKKKVSPKRKFRSQSMNQTPIESENITASVKKKVLQKRNFTSQITNDDERKRRRLIGEAYISTAGKKVEKKVVQDCDCSKCFHKCNKKLSYEKRCAILNFYYGLDSYEKQRDFIRSNVRKKVYKNCSDETGTKVKKITNVHRIYSFEVGKKRFRVCQKFFLKTLGISREKVNQAILKESSGHFVGRVDHSRHIAPYGDDGGELREIRNHIESFPTEQSHYARQSSNQKYLAADLNIGKMYEAYVINCMNKNFEPVTEAIYSQVFDKEYNFTFHQLYYDQCPLCKRYYTACANRSITDFLQEQYQMHQAEKEVVQRQKDNDIKTAKESKSVHTCTFYFQPTLYAPCSKENHMMYMYFRKFYCYNMSVHSAADKKATCFVWSEIDGKRGSNEISTCLNLYISRLDPSVQHVILYSDVVSGENRNQIIATCLLYSVTKLENIQMIDCKVIEKGCSHNMMVSDELKSALECTKSRGKVLVPHQWETVISMARRKDPYSVVRMEHHNFKDFKGMKYKSTGKETSEAKARWNNIKWMRFKKETPDTCYYKYDLEDTDFQTVKMVGKKNTENPPQQLYSTKLPISMAKKQDLVSMCQHGVIPNEFYHYYNSLPASTTSCDRLPEPDCRELHVDTDIEEEELEETELYIDTDIIEKQFKVDTNTKEEELESETDSNENEFYIETNEEESDENTDNDTDIKGESVIDTDNKNEESDLDTKIEQIEVFY